jgi:hypothetical protein
MAISPPHFFPWPVSPLLQHALTEPPEARRHICQKAILLDAAVMILARFLQRARRGSCNFLGKLFQQLQ